MSMSEERTRVVETSLTKEEEKIGLRNKELLKIWQAEYAIVTDETRNLLDAIDDMIKKSIVDVNLEEFLKEENNDSETS